MMTLAQFRYVKSREGHPECPRELLQDQDSRFNRGAAWAAAHEGLMAARGRLRAFIVPMLGVATWVVTVAVLMGLFGLWMDGQGKPPHAEPAPWAATDSELPTTNEFQIALPIGNALTF